MHFIYLILLLFQAFSSSVGQRGKRILVGDIDVQQQLHDIQTLKAGFSDMQAKMQSLENTVSSLRSTISLQEQTIQQLTNVETTGAVYTRWGKTTCPGNGTELVYSGLAAGGYHDHYGSAAEYVCLPHDPYFYRGKKARNTAYPAYIYGAEYEDDVFGNGLHQKDVPCALCLARRSSTSLLVPGKISCPTGWQLEYFGLLASNGHNHAAAGQYVCVDHQPEPLESGSANDNGKLFYPVHVVCGSLHCPPYESGELVTCAVCSR